MAGVAVLGVLVEVLMDTLMVRILVALEIRQALIHLKVIMVVMEFLIMFPTQTAVAVAVQAQ
jgi:hypothetical protein